MTKHFIYFSKDAVTSGKALSQNSLMRANIKFPLDKLFRSSNEAFCLFFK